MSYLTRDPSLRLLNGGIGPLESDTHYSQASGRLIHVTPELYNLSRGTAIRRQSVLHTTQTPPEQSKVKATWMAAGTVTRYTERSTIMWTLLAENALDPVYGDYIRALASWASILISTGPPSRSDCPFAFTGSSWATGTLDSGRIRDKADRRYSGTNRTPLPFLWGKGKSSGTREGSEGEEAEQPARRFSTICSNVSPTQESASATTSANASQWPRSIMVTPKFYDQMPESETIFATVQLAEDLQPPGTDPALEDIEAWMAQQLKDYKVYGSMRESWDRQNEHHIFHARLNKVLPRLEEKWSGIKCVRKSIVEQFSSPGGPPILDGTSMPSTAVQPRVTRVPIGPRGWRPPQNPRPVPEATGSSRFAGAPKGPRAGSTTSGSLGYTPRGARRRFARRNGPTGGSTA
ncbi:hypothetical protein DB88DRAFT_548980 [Papiliotrema laurentii]|uniref:Uncharacterized protein n=1 Tax=Papiliotrema laurentii TaxID=5418 RepID=A0AAD9CUC5_PAPLA|nr:hypothetical protein DB88DRAFT_548980 [Papiliotrema laurentii]